VLAYSWSFSLSPPSSAIHIHDFTHKPENSPVDWLFARWTKRQKNRLAGMSAAFEV
jgi:hypothetical protein